jgi:hypothetical protein
MLLVLSGCVPGALPIGGEELNPFEDLPVVEMNGQPQALTYNVAPLGELAVGQLVRVLVEGEGIESVLLLAEDPESPDAGRIAGGGEPGVAFDCRVQIAGRYFVYVQFADGENSSRDRAVLTVGPGDPAYAPPARQAVRVFFEEAFLTNPGLVDPESFTPEEQQVLADISGSVEQEVLAELRRIFADTPIDILSAADPASRGPESTLTYSPQRVLAEENISFDAALPGVEPGSPCAADAVIFGEVLPHGTRVDPGNRRLDDVAFVYVGSFQGRGLACRTAVVNSLNHIVLALAHTGAHEIGHLVGLYHVSLTDIMDRRPTLAFQRELDFARGQVLIEIPQPTAGGVEVETRVLTSVIQDPEFYFRANFAGQ